MLRSAITAGVSMLILAGVAHAGPTGWYIGLSGGANVIEDTNFKRTVAPLSVPAKFDTGWAVMGNVGYRWDSRWRMEFELAFRSNDFDTTGPVSTGDVTQFTQMANLFLDLELSERTTFSLGVGVGGDLVTLNTAPALGNISEDDYVLAGQLIAQLSYAVSQRLDLYLDARYFVADDPEFGFGVGQRLKFDDRKWSFSVGLRYDLVADAEPVVAPPPMPPAPPPPVAARQYIVFFGWNKSDLTKQAQATVAQAAATARESGSASILVVGHTDTSGGARYNQKLSERRANRVANELVRNGIPVSAISALGKGETELSVQTGDGVREPQNRRVEINL